MSQRLWLVLALVAGLIWPAVQPTPAAGAACTDEALLVSEVIDPPAGVVEPEATFTVEWTLRNDGDCTWDRNYRLLFVSGERFDGARASRVRTQVTPGATLTLSLDLTAPAEPGDYAGTWRLRNQDGAPFGPELVAAVQVSTETGGETDVVLPEVLAFGGMGAGGGEGEDPCLFADGTRFAGPGLLVKDQYLEERIADLYLCGFAPDSELTVELTNPEGDTFTRRYGVEAAQTYVDDTGAEYKQTSVWAQLRWPDRAPSGSWEVYATDGEIEQVYTLDLPEPRQVMVSEGYADATFDLCRFADGTRFEGPGLLVDEQYLEYSSASLYLCGYAPGSELTVELTGPDGGTHTYRYIVGEPVAYADAEGAVYEQTSLPINLQWPDRAPSGAWDVYVTGGELEQVYTLEVPDAAPLLEAYPVGPIDPFAAAQGCSYAYTPGQRLVIAGSRLPPNAVLKLGIYQVRLYTGYLVDEQTVTTDADGAFTLRATTPGVGEYQLRVVQSVDPAGYKEDGITYEDYLAGNETTAATCYSVFPDEPEEVPWRLAFVQGAPGATDVVALDMTSGNGYYPTYHFGECDSSEPAWWPGGEWVVYGSNCVEGEPDEETEIPTILTGAYDLYAELVVYDESLAPEEQIVQLTATPDLDETEPDVDPDGYVVYRQAPAGTPLDEVGELWMLDIFEEESYALGLMGRAPVWSPDGTRLAFKSDEEGGWRIYVYDWEKETVWPVTEACPTHCRFPAWSPDGKQLIYSTTQSRRNLTPDGLWIVSAEGGKPRQWLAGPYDRPSWSSEGWIAFHGPDGIYRAEAKARAPEPERYLYSMEEAYWAPVWTR